MKQETILSGSNLKKIPTILVHNLKNFPTILVHYLKKIERQALDTFDYKHSTYICVDNSSYINFHKVVNIYAIFWYQCFRTTNAHYP